MLVYCAMNAYVAYDRHGAELTAAHPNTITEDHVRCINAMGARSKPERWGPFMPGTALLTLLPLEPDPSSYLLAMTDDQWAAVMPHLSTVLNKITADASGIGLAAVTKMLHLHRPSLIPAGDSRLLALFQVAPGSATEQALGLMEALRRCVAPPQDGNLAVLDGLQTDLAGIEMYGHAIELTPLRLLEAICWMQATPSYQNLWLALGWDTAT